MKKAITKILTISAFLLALVVTPQIISGLFSGAASMTSDVTNAEQQPFVAPTKQEFLTAINTERSKAGIAKLDEVQEIDQSAQFKAEDMVNRSYYEHKDPTTGKLNGLDYLSSIYPNCSYASENIMWASGSARTAKEIVASWMSSKDHRDAILDTRYTQTGFGISGTDKMYFVEHFCIPN